MITIKGTRTNFGYGYPDVNYGGVSIIGGYPNTGFVPQGLGSLSLTDPVTLGLVAVAAYFAYKNKSKLGF